MTTARETIMPSNAGRRPLPTKLRILHGERHQDRLNQDEPVPVPTSPQVPTEASLPVQLVWRETVRELEGMGLAYASDADSLRCFCEAVVQHRRASAVLSKSPVLVVGLHGNLVRNPALQIQRDCAQTIRAFAQEFGLTPSARSSIRSREAGGPIEDNPYADSGS
jgi:P27 family predicted phage terminase small subunit